MLTTAAIDANVNATGGDSATYKKTDAKRYTPVVTLSTENNAKLTKQLSEGFKRPAYYNKYKVIGNILVEITHANREKHIRDSLDSSYQGVKRFFVLAYDNKAGDDQVSVDSFKKYFLPRAKNYKK